MLPSAHPPPAAPQTTIHGRCLEPCTADVYAGPRVAIGEVDLAGKQALLAWKVTQGTFAGEDLEVLAAMDVVLAQTTVGHPHASHFPTRPVLLVDHPETDRQRTALAKDLSAGLLGEVVHVRALPPAVAVDGHATGRAGGTGLGRVRTGAAALRRRMR